MMLEQREATDKKNTKCWKSRKLVIILICLLLVFMSMSPFSDTIYWDAAFPRAEFHLRVVDQKSRPIQKASLTVISKETGETAYGVPFTNYANGPLQSDQDGIIILYHTPLRIEYGGTASKLFYLFPIGFETPEFIVEIRADGYEPNHVLASKLYNLVTRNKESDQITTRSINGKEITFKVYDYVVIMKSH